VLVGQSAKRQDVTNREQVAAVKRLDQLFLRGDLFRP